MDKQQIYLTKNWRFHLGDIPESFSKTYQDVDWEKVEIPHDWSIKQPFSTEHSSGTGYVTGGIGWYRCSFFLDEQFRGKHISIVFDGVYKNSQVWCNSYYKGSWPYGYTTFRHDITNDVCFGKEENLICVKVSHTDISDSRWFTGSGITRKVTLLIEDEIHPVADGVFFQTPNVSKEKAEILIANQIENSSSNQKKVTIKNVLKDKESNEILSLSSTCILEKNTMCESKQSGILTNPILWSTQKPYLYTLETYMKYEDVESTDNTSWYLANTMKVGIRSFAFHPDTGFTLNNVSQKLKGVCLHHDAGCLGAAVTPLVWIRRLLKLKEMGCNAIRMSHNPHMPELYDLCDSLGFFVMDEAFDEWEGAKNKWSTGHNVYPPKHQGYYEVFPEWHEKDLIALIRRDRNHPSIIMWSIGNEIDYPNDPYCHPLFQSMTGNNDKNKPAAEREYNPNKPNATRLVSIANRLVEIVKTEDTSRPITLASAFPELSARLGLYENLDVIGYNYKEHLYEEDHKSFSNQPILGSENGHGYQEWLAVTKNEYIAGQFLWTGIDYLGEAYGWPIHGSSAGLLTLAGFEKPAYYRRKSLWANHACIYLATTRYEMDNHEFTPVYESWNYIPGEEVEVRCYTNLGSAELFLNEKSLGIKEASKDTGYISFVVPFEEGLLKAVAKHKDASLTSLETTLTAFLQTTYAPCKINLQEFTCAKSLNEVEDFYQENLHQIEVTIEDQDSNRVVTDSSMLHIGLEENAILLGLENGDLADVTGYFEPARRAYEGRMLIYLKKKDPSQPAKIKVEGANLKTKFFAF